MTDLIYGRGITDLIREMPFYFSIFNKIIGIKFFHSKPFMYGSADIINVCNLHCTHCYWWLNRKSNEQDGLTNRSKPAWKDIWITMTINSLNHSCVEDLIKEWDGIVNKVGFQFHTPFTMNDPLWVPFGPERTRMVDKLIELRDRYPNFVINSQKQLELMKGNWGGTGTIPVECPSWAILSLDHLGRVKQPCCIGSADTKNGMKPICERCGLGCYSVLVANGIKGDN